MNGLAKLWTIAEIELRQRLVSRTFLIIVCAFGGTLLLLSGLIFAGWASLTNNTDEIGLVFTTTLWLTVFVGTVLVPVLSGGTVNGDRNSGTLATTQLTLVTTWQLLLGKVLAAWLSSLAMVAVAVPFLVLGAAISGLPLFTVPAAIGILVLEFGVFSALGVAWSAIVRSTVFSVVCTYLTLALLSVGSALGFAIGGMLLATTSSVTYITPVYEQVDGTRVRTGCETTERDVASMRWDLVYPVLALNPYVIVVDALPAEFEDGNPVGMIAGQQSLVRLAQVTPDMGGVVDTCNFSHLQGGQTTEELLRGTLPTWPIGALLQIGLVGLLLWWGWSGTRTPARRMPVGSRVA